MALLLLLHIALLSTLCAADDPYVFYDFKLSYITISPLGVPQRSLQKYVYDTETLFKLLCLLPFLVTKGRLCFAGNRKALPQCRCTVTTPSCF
ncbi:hypothetical protein V6N13_030778 [Hibiscus sabdariffa]